MTGGVSPQAQPRGRVVVTGIGVVCAAGIGIDSVWDRLQSGPPAPSTFVAPPPTLLPYLPLAIVPLPVATVVLMAGCFAGAAWAIRMVGWWKRTTTASAGNS